MSLWRELVVYEWDCLTGLGRALAVVLPIALVLGLVLALAGCGPVQASDDEDPRAGILTPQIRKRATAEAIRLLHGLLCAQLLERAEESGAYRAAHLVLCLDQPSALPAAPRSLGPPSTPLDAGVL